LRLEIHSKKNILFINPWIYDFTAYDFWLRPLGLLYIASLIKKHTDLQVSFIDCLDRYHPLLDKKLKTKPDGRGPFFKEEIQKPLVLKEIPRKYSRYGIPLSLFSSELDAVPQPDLVLVTCTMTYWYPGVQLVVELIRKKFGPIPVILGGVYATLMPEHAKSSSGADIILEGPGERSILPLLRKIFGDKFSPEYRFTKLEEIPWPAYELLKDKSVLPFLTSRGCPFDCSFCASPLLFEKFEQNLPSAVVDQIEKIHRIYKVQNLAFYDDALLLNRKNHIFPILERIVQKGLPIAFHTPNGLHVNEIDFEMASLLKKADFQSLFLSQESFDEKLLKRSCPKVKRGDLEKALANLEKAGYKRQQINIYHLVGLPGQDVTSIKEGILHIRRLGARPHLAYFSPVPGTRDWQWLVEKGRIKKDADPLIHNKLTFPYLWRDIPPEEFESLKDLVNKSIL